MRFFKRAKNAIKAGPSGILCRLTGPILPGLWILNFIVQRIFRINSKYPWMIHFTSRAIGDIKIGQEVWFSFAVSGGCYFQGRNGIVIGDNTIFAPNVCIISSNHDLGNFQKWQEGPPVVIGKNCWLSAGVKIMPGVSLGDNVVVAANAVVTKSFPSNVIIAGVPAVIIKERRTNNIDKHVSQE